jgi:hypothetical protein
MCRPAAPSPTKVILRHHLAHITAFEAGHLITAFGLPDSL